MLIRLGKGNDLWALLIPNIVPMVSGSRIIQGWVRADHQVYGDDELRAKLLSCSLWFVRSLPVPSSKRNQLRKKNDDPL
jgi:hypothetical protein